MNRFLSVFLLLASCLPVLGQTVKQSGNVTPGHATSWTTNGIIQDAGTAANGFLSSLGVVGQGQTICQSTAPPTAPGYQQVCWNISDATGVSLVIQNFGTDTPQPFSIVLNGTTYNFPYTVGGITGPVSSTVGDIALFNNTSGSLLSDSGVLGSDVALLDGNNTFTGNNTFSGTNVVSPDLFSILGPSSSLISGANMPNELLIEAGSTGAPITAGNTPTVQISRVESITNGTSTGDGSLGAALRIDASTNNTQQLNGFKVTVTNLTGATHDTVAIYGAATDGGTVSSTSHGYAGYFVSDATTAGNYGVGVGTGVFNNTGSSSAYSSGFCCGFTAFDAVAETSALTSTYMGAAFTARGSTNALWDVGLAFQPSAINTADIQSDSSATYMWIAPSGTHNYGIYWSSTFSVAAIQTPGFIVGPTGAVTAGTLALAGATLHANALAVTGSINATAGYTVGGGGGAPGVNCSGSPTSGFVSSLGIVTHC